MNIRQLISNVARSNKSLPKILLKSSSTRTSSLSKNHVVSSSSGRTRNFNSTLRILSSQQQNKENYTVLSVDTSGLVQETYDRTVVKEHETPMVKHLKNKIKGAGPISVSTFIQETLLNPIYGYYYTAKKSTTSSDNSSNNNNNNNNPKQNVIGREGDFVTSPEISSVFSEMIGLWCVDMWTKLGKPKQIELVELGPGKGTLMHDLLDSLVQSKNNSSTIDSFRQAVKKVTMCEASEALKEVQKEKLKSFTESHEFNWVDRFDKYSDFNSNMPVLIIAHEFFDALPVYHFEYTERGWMEVLVDIDDSKDTPHHFKFVLSPGPTMATAFVSLVEGKKEVGSIREVCAMGIGYVEKIAEILNNRKGGSLIIDYGNDYPMGFTLQGIYQHRFTETPLEKPGEVDLSTFVDFSSLRRAVDKFKNVKVYGPQYQSDFLHQMGMDARFAKLLQNPKLSSEQVTAMITAYERLTHPTEMGYHYKAMALAHLPSHKVGATGFDINLVPKKEPTPNMKSQRVVAVADAADSTTTSNIVSNKEGETSKIKASDKKVAPADVGMFL